VTARLDNNPSTGAGLLVIPTVDTATGVWHNWHRTASRGHPLRALIPQAIIGLSLMLPITAVIALPCARFRSGTSPEFSAQNPSHIWRYVKMCERIHAPPVQILNNFAHVN